MQKKQYFCSMKQMNDIEIMAPVGCWESLAAAIEAGATSVYFGIEHLNMRSRSSANFTTQDLHTIVERCQAVGVKTYLTLNTGMYPEDLPLIQLYCGGKVDGILADLGVSSYQFDTPEKGFSIRYNGRLDMRMNKNAAVDAANIVNTYDVTTLASVLSRYGELRNAMAIADAVAMAREVKPIETTDELKEAVSRFLPRGSENKVLAQIFQALRIEVNEEMKVLELTVVGEERDIAFVWYLGSREGTYRSHYVPS